MGTTDVRNPSLWVATSSCEQTERLEGDRTADVVVVGAGIAGLTTARLLSAAGLSVVVIEAGEVCAGVTGYTTAKVTSLHSAVYSRLSRSWGAEVAATYADANEAAIARILELVRSDGIDCELEAASAYTYTESMERVGAIESEVDAATAAGLRVSLTTTTDLPYDVAAAVRLDAQAQFHPRRYCLGLLDAIRRDGGAVFDRTRALGMDADAGQVRTDRGTVTAAVIVVASHIPFIDAGGYFARMEPVRSYAIAFRSEAERPRGMYISIDDPSRSIRSTADGWVIVGGEGHKVGQDEDTTKRYEALEAWAQDRFSPASIEYRWSAQDYVSTDGLPFIGRLTSHSDRVFIATGFGKWGMTNATVAAMIIADLAQGRTNEWAATFDSTRLAPKQAVGGVLRENVDVAKHFVGDRLGSLGADDVKAVGAGMGAIATLDGDKVAAFRDDDGRLHAVSATCTHLGCQVAFNTAERTWDCPCHGSRFDIDGHVLQGPAVVDLAPKNA